MCKNSLLSRQQSNFLLGNGIRRLHDHCADTFPVAKIFAPDGPATWLLTELDPLNPDLAFALCDLGMGTPELGYVSLAELRTIRGRLGLPVERDRFFHADKPVSAYLAEARTIGRIVA